MKLSKGDASVLLLGLIVLLLVFGIIFLIITFSSNPVDDALNTNRVINVLFIIEDNKKPLSTYVLMYYPVTKRAAVFDVPGDIGLLIAKTNLVDRIDSVYEPSRTGNFQNEIEKLLNIKIDFSMVITKENLVSIVDLLEGVEIFIPLSISHLDDDGIILFPSGMTVLDGDKASLYAVYSLPDEDSEMEIFRRQRFFLGLLNRQIQMNDMLSNKKAAKMYYSFFKTSMSQKSLMRLFDEFNHIDTDRVNIQSVSGNLRSVSGQRLIIPLYEGNLIKDIVRQTVEALTREVEGFFIEQALTVEILNGTSVNGLAGRTADVLSGFGYVVISIGNADRNNYDNTLIIHRSGDENLVNDFADIIRCTNIRREPAQDDQEDGSAAQDAEYKADITLVLGRNFNGRHVVNN